MLQSPAPNGRLIPSVISFNKTGLIKMGGWVVVEGRIKKSSVYFGREKKEKTKKKKITLEVV